ncbi:MAG: hypothetical protein ACJ747_07615 [Gaiellaceae bacterium]|jgi:hypothetical protein
MATAPESLRLPLRRRRAIPLSEAGALHGALRRTTIVRIGLAALLVALAAVSVWRAAELNPRAVSFLPQHSTTVLVLDQSKSVYISAYKRISAVLRRIAAADVPIGLVAFSDSAYEMIPPGTRGSELRPLLRFYTPGHGGSNVDPETLFAANPWQDVFSGGTKISSGLDLAASLLHRDHVHDGAILLLSDLETAGEDQPRLAQSLLQIQRDHDITLKVVPLFPVEGDQEFFERFVPKSNFVRPAQINATKTPPARRRLIAATPWPLLVTAALLLLALAANELLCGRVQLRAANEAAA